MNILDNLNNAEKDRLTEIETGVRTRITEMKKHRYEIGKILDEARTLLPHGFFQKWREQTFGDHLPYSTGHFYMRCYRTFKDDPAALEYIPTKYLHKMTENDFPCNVRVFLTEKIKDHGPPNDTWDDIVEFYNMYKDDMFDEEGLLYCVKRLLTEGKEEWPTAKRDNAGKHFDQFLKATEQRQSLYKKAHRILKRLNKLIKKGNDYAWLYPFNPDDKLHDSVIEGVDESIERLRDLIKMLKRTKKSLVGGEALFNPVSTPEGIKFIPDEQLGITITHDEVDTEIDWSDFEDWADDEFQNSKE